MDRRTRWRALSEPRAATFDGEGEKGRGAAMNSQGERHTPREPKETHEVEVAAPLSRFTQNGNHATADARRWRQSKKVYFFKNIFFIYFR